jgi:hypothetical protein
MRVSRWNCSCMNTFCFYIGWAWVLVKLKWNGSRNFGLGVIPAYSGIYSSHIIKRDTYVCFFFRWDAFGLKGVCLPKIPFLITQVMNHLEGFLGLRIKNPYWIEDTWLHLGG